MRSAGSRGMLDLLVLYPGGHVSGVQVKSGALSATDQMQVQSEMLYIFNTFGIATYLWHYLGDNQWRVYTSSGTMALTTTEAPKRPLNSPHEKQTKRNKSKLSVSKDIHRTKGAKVVEPTGQD